MSIVNQQDDSTDNEKCAMAFKIPVSCCRDHLEAHMYFSVCIE